jgi:hypothetical protein
MSYGSTDRVISRQGASPDDLGFGSQSDLETFIDDLREQASDEVRRYVDVELDLVENHVDYLTGNGQRIISTPNDPVRTIHRLEVSGASLTEGDDYRLKPTPGNPDQNTGRLERIRGYWRSGAEIEIEYDWGYGDQYRPRVVDAVVEDMAVKVLEKAVVDRSSSGKSSESMDGFSVSWDNSDLQQYLTLDKAKRKRLEPLKRQGVA